MQNQQSSLTERPRYNTPYLHNALLKYTRTLIQNLAKKRYKQSLKQVTQ